MSKKANVADLLKSLFFLLYFVILTVERVISFSAVIADKVLFWGVYFEYYAIAQTALALIGGWGYLLIKGRRLFKLTALKTAEDFLQPSVAAGILLLGGMVHTHGSVPPIQFAAYGFLLAAMGIFCGECVKEKGSAEIRWLSFAYITAFSMAIPVIYGSSRYCAGCDFCNALYSAEIIVSVGLAAAFTCMLYSFFKNDGINVFSPKIIAAAVIGDGLVLFFKWHAEINYFVLVSICAAAVLWAVGKVIAVRKS